MNEKNAKEMAGGLAAISGVLVIVGLLSARTLCACTDANTNFSLAVGAPPMKADPAVFREKLLKKLPPGATIVEINKFLASVTADGDKVNGRYRDGLCQRISNRLSCNFPTKTEWCGNRKIGFDLHFTLDGSDRLEDARVSPYSIWFSG